MKRHPGAGTPGWEESLNVRGRLVYGVDKAAPAAITTTTSAPPGVRNLVVVMDIDIRPADIVRIIRIRAGNESAVPMPGLAGQINRQVNIEGISGGDGDRVPVFIGACLGRLADTDAGVL
jgi:hypothetical protein